MRTEYNTPHLLRINNYKDKDNTHLYIMNVTEVWELDGITGLVPPDSE